MRPRIIASVTVSLLLIFTASWFRFTSANDNQNELISVNNGDFQPIGINVDDVLSSNSNLAELEKNESGVDYISKQLFGDYLTLSLSGDASEEKLTDLANKYAENIATLNQAPRISSQDISIVEDTKANMQIYADEFVENYVRYQKSLVSKFDPKKDYTKGGAELQILSKNLNTLYENEAEALKNMNVPVSLVSSHIKLVNIYLSNAWAWESLSKVEEDPAYAYAGIVLQKENMESENKLVVEIDKIITRNGI
jgi:hypothetical protein